MDSSMLGLLAPKTTSFIMGGGGGVSRSLLNRVEVAGVLAGLPDEVECFARAKYVGEIGALGRLSVYTRQYIASVAVSDRWKLTGRGPDVDSMAQLISIEAVGAAICCSCNSVNLTGSRCACNTGKVLLNDSVRARFIGIDRSVYSKYWSSRYENVYRFLCSFDDKIYYAINKS